MQGGCYQFLAGSARSRDERCPIVRRNAPDPGENLKQEWTAPDHAFELVGFQEFGIEL